MARGGYLDGLAAIGDDDRPGRAMRVKSVNAAVYAAGPEPATPGADLGDPLMMLQPGAEVKAVGPPFKNPKGVDYMPVTVKGQDGLCWIRASSLAEMPAAAVGPGPKTQPEPPTAKAGMPWWGWLLAAGGAAALGAGAYLGGRK